MATQKDGTLWGWGSNSTGELGLGLYGDKKTPMQAGTGTDWQMVNCGGYYSVGMKKDGTLWAWGWNDYGELGIGNITTKNTPTQIGTLNTWQAYDAGASHVSAIQNDGSLWAWGYNMFYELGDGTTVNRTSPVSIACPTSGVGVATIGSNASLSLYPNPATGMLFIKSSSPLVIQDVDVVDISGRCVISQKDHLNAIDVSRLNPGIYFLEVLCDGTLSHYQFLKQ
jgi:hypothetical protein